MVGRALRKPIGGLLCAHFKTRPASSLCGNIRESKRSMLRPACYKQRFKHSERSQITDMIGSEFTLLEMDASGLSDRVWVIYREAPFPYNVVPAVLRAEDRTTTHLVGPRANPSKRHLVRRMQHALRRERAYPTTGH